jgi:tetratricopeptide (TPR) repeat protein
VPPLADSFNPRPETGFNAAGVLAPGLTAVLTQPAHADETGRYPLAGLGGTGKTQLAAALAHSVWGSGEVDLLAWVPASSRDAVITGYAQALAATGAANPGPDLDSAAASFLGWLAETSRPWLVVLDDLADLADLEGLWPHGQAGLVVVTTRLPAMAVGANGRKILQVGAFSQREALSYLTARLYEEPGMRAGALDLAMDLGCLPLCLAQASAVVADSASDCRVYRAQLTDRTRQMSVTEAGRYTAAVTATWSLSLDRAEYGAPPGMARNALAFVALLDPGGIPAAVLTSQAACDFICGRRATGTPDDEGQVRGVLDSLARVGLVTIDPGSASRTVRMHRLVQATIQQVMPPSIMEQTTAAAASALQQAWPEHDLDQLAAQALRGCAASLHRAAGDLLWAPEAHPVLLRAGQSLDHSRLTGPAIAYWQAMITTSSRLLGPGHASTRTARDSLAAAYVAAGRPADAIGIQEQLLAEREKALGRDHPETLTALSGLARACLAGGRQEDAILLHERTLADRERVLGPDHPATLATRGDLATACLAAGRVPDAIAILQRALSDRSTVLGPDHPDTLSACSDLATALHQAGRLKEAFPLYKRALADRERLQGATHPDTMTARANLAYAYRSADKLKDALPIYARTYADRQQVLGPDHPDTLTSLSNLASAYHTARKLKQALPLYEQALSSLERLHGPDHPETLAARGNLASAYHSGGRIALAIPLYEQTLQDHERVMGPDHPNTLTARANLASAYHAVGRLTDAIAVFEHTLADCERFLPPGHPLTQAIRENLAAAT